MQERNLTELKQLSQRCSLDPEVYLRMADIYIRQSDFAEASVQLQSL